MLTMDGTEVMLGVKTYMIKPAVMVDSDKWCDELFEVIKQLPLYGKVTNENPVDFTNALNELLIVSPHKIIDLFFKYVPYIDRKEVETQASHAQIIKAFNVCVDFEKPFLSLLAMTMLRVRN